MIVAHCPRCAEPIRVPSTTLPDDTYAQCPLCRETFAASELLDRLPPVVQLIGADGEPMAIPEPGPDLSSDFDSSESTLGMVAAGGAVAAATFAAGSAAMGALSGNEIEPAEIDVAQIETIEMDASDVTFDDDIEDGAGDVLLDADPTAETYTNETLDDDDVEDYLDEVAADDDEQPASESTVLMDTLMNDGGGFAAVAAEQESVDVESEVEHFLADDESEEFEPEELSEEFVEDDEIALADGDELMVQEVALEDELAGQLGNVSDSSSAVVAPMKVRSRPTAPRKKGSSIKTLLGIVLGPLLALPLAGAILLAIGKAPDLGFWPFVGNDGVSSPQVSANPPGLGAPMQLKTQSATFGQDSGLVLADSEVGEFVAENSDPVSTDAADTTSAIDGAADALIAQDAQPNANATVGTATDPGGSAMPGASGENAATADQGIANAGEPDAIDSAISDVLSKPKPGTESGVGEFAMPSMEKDSSDTGGSMIDSALADTAGAFSDPFAKSPAIDDAITEALDGPAASEGLGTDLSAVEMTDPVSESGVTSGGSTDADASRDAIDAMFGMRTQDKAPAKPTASANRDAIDAMFGIPAQDEVPAEATTGDLKMPNASDPLANLDAPTTAAVPDAGTASTPVDDSPFGAGIILDGPAVTDSPELIDATEKASSAMLSLITKRASGEASRKDLARTYATICRVGEMQSNSKSLAMQRLLVEIGQSSLMDDFAGDTARQWLRYGKRPTDGILLVGTIVGSGDDTKMDIGDGVLVSVSPVAGSGLPADSQKAIGIGEIIGDNQVRLNAVYRVN